MIIRKEIFIREAIVSFALGAIPIILTFIARGENQMLDRLAALKPSDDIFIYFCALLLLHGTVCLISWWCFKSSDNIGTIINFAHSVTEQIGFGIHGIYRAITGAVPMALLLLIYRHGSTGAAQATVLSVILVLVSLPVCCWLSLINEKTKRRQSFLS